MKTCPRCGYYNPDTAVSCGQCDRELLASDNAVAPPSRMSSQPQEPVPLPPPAFWTKQRQYRLGLGLGLVPVVLSWAGVGNVAWPCTGGPLLQNESLIAAAGYLYAAQIVGGLICVCFDRTRSVGYGLLTMALVDPIVAAVGCVVLIAHPTTATASC
jgi:hypothetical protein